MEQTSTSVASKFYLEKLLQTKQLELNSLLEVTQAISNNLPIESLFRIYEFILRAQMGIECLAVYVSDRSGNTPTENEEQEISWQCVCSFGVDAVDEELDVEKELLKFKETTELKGRKSKALSKFRVVIPVYHKEHALAYALLAKNEIEDQDTYQEHLKFVQTITNIIVVAVENRRLFNRQLKQEGMKKELDLAAQMQNMLIPSDFPKNKAYEIGAVYLPHQEVGGDYYDFIQLTEDEIIFVIADISGKGVAAALLMANFQATLRAMVKQKLEPDKFVRILNKSVNKITKGEKFITMFMGKYNMRSRELLYVNAGHNPPILLNKQNVKQLDSGTTILGMFDKLPFVNIGKIKIQPNSLLITYTDGLTDVENELFEHYEIEKLIEFTKKHSKLKIDDFNNRLIDELVEFKGQQVFTDDITLLSLRLI